MTEDTVELNTLRGDMAVALFWHQASDGMTTGQIRQLVVAALEVARKYGAGERSPDARDRVYAPGWRACPECGGLGAVHGP